MRITWLAHSIPKLGNRLEENEDAYYPPWDSNEIFGKPKFVCTLSDGATRTSFSSLWAKLLVEHFEGSVQGICEESLSPIQGKWAQKINSMNLPWHAEEKVKQGSYATLLWLRINQSRTKAGGSWRAEAVGDSCLFQLRNGELISPFPIASSQEFSNNPVLVSSKPANNVSLWEKVSKKKHRWEVGDQFFLMTDALAAWFLKQYEDENQSVERFTELTSQPLTFKLNFEGLVSELRNSNAIKNDDTSVIWIRLGG